MSEQQQPKSALDRISDLENLVRDLGARLGETRQTVGFVARDMVGLQTGVSGLAKTLSATLDELKDAKIITDEGLMSRIRKIDDENDKGKLSQMVEAGFLEEAAEVSSESLVVISQKQVKTDGTIRVLSNHMTIEIPGLDPQEKTFQELLGKKRGEQFKLNAGDDTFILVRVDKVYNLKQSGGQQSPAPEQAEAPAAEQPAAESEAKAE